MLLKKYPDKKTTVEDRVDCIKNATNIKKAKSNLSKNAIIAIVIIIISLFIKNIFFTVLCILVALYPLLMSAYSLRYIALLNKKNIETLIYDDKIIHCQYNLFLTKLNKYTIFYNDIKSSTQDLMGNIIVTLNSHDFEFEQIKNNKNTYITTKKELIKLNFIESDAKYYLIKKMSRDIKYK